MKIVFISHPISGDVNGNLMKIKNIVRNINLKNKELVPFVPYYADCIALNDTIPAERNRGLKNIEELFKRKIIDEVWLCGDKISRGMIKEIKLVQKYNIPVYPTSSKMLLLMEKLIAKGKT
jgi:hypothetical protein